MKSRSGELVSGWSNILEFVTIQKHVFDTFILYFQVYDGYFVHYFAPRGLPVVPKDVIFVIDVSGSMIGTKIKQVKWTNFTDYLP